MFETLTRFIPVLEPDCFDPYEFGPESDIDYPDAVYRFFDSLDAFEDVQTGEELNAALKELRQLRDREEKAPGTILKALLDGSLTGILEKLKESDGKRAAKVCAIGELLIDFGEEEEENGFPLLQAMPGGAPANFLAALSRYGIQSSLIAKVGKDRFGESLVKQLKALGIDTGGIVTDPDHFTTLAFVTRDESGERRFDFARKHGADTCLRYSEIRTDLIDEADVLHFGSVSLTDEPSADCVKKAVIRAKSLGKLISFDPNLRLPLWQSEAKARRMIRWGLEQTDLLKISEEELDFLKLGSPEKAVGRLFDRYGLSLVMLTMGEKGCFLKNGQASCLLPAVAEKAVDTTGAGDIFGGSALSCILKKGKALRDLDEKDLGEIAAFANAAAGLSVLKKGGMLSVPSEEEVRKRLEKA